MGAWWPRDGIDDNHTVNSYIPKFQVEVKMILFIHNLNNSKFILPYFNWPGHIYIHMSINHVYLKWCRVSTRHCMGWSHDFMNFFVKKTLQKPSSLNFKIFVILRGLGYWWATETIPRDLTVLPFLCLRHGKTIDQVSVIAINAFMAFLLKMSDLIMPYLTYSQFRQILDTILWYTYF